MEVFKSNWSETGNSMQRLKELCKELTSLYDAEAVTGSEIKLLSIRPKKKPIASFNAFTERLIEPLEGFDPSGIKTLSDLHKCFRTSELMFEERDGILTAYRIVADENEDSVMVNFIEKEPFKQDPSTGIIYVPSTKIHKEDAEEFQAMYADNNSPYSIFLYIDKKVYFTDKSYVDTVRQVSLLKGEYLSDDNLLRNMTLAKYLPDKRYTLVYLHSGKYRKALALRGEGFRPETCMQLYTTVQNIQSEAGEVLGKCTLKNFVFTHKIKDIFLILEPYGKELQEKYNLPEGLVPGILVRTSNTGYSSFKVCSIWYVRNEYFVYGKEISIQHKNSFDLSTVYEELSNTVYPQYLEFAKKLSLLSKKTFDNNELAWNKIFAKVERKLDTAVVGKRVIKAVKSALMTKNFSNSQEAYLGLVATSLKKAANDAAKSYLTEKASNAFIDLFI